MHPATRSQADHPEVADRESRRFAKRIPDDPSQDLTRQEFRDEADVNYLLSKYGVNTPYPNRVPQYGDTDWDLDLHEAHIALDRAQFAFFQLPDALREEYGNPSGMLDAMHSGDLAKRLAEVLKGPASPAPENGSEGNSEPPGGGENPPPDPSS